jgi:nicotinamide riboside kinase
MSRPRIAIWGAPQTGKTWLAQALGAALTPINAFAVFDNPDWPQQPNGTTERRWDLILLTGLDLAGMATLHRQFDQTLRNRLTQHALPYATVYGNDGTRCANALQAIRFHFRDPTALQSAPSRWRWPCEKCSDSECEHRLFSALVRPNNEGLAAGTPQG